MGLSMYVANVNADGTPVAVSHETHILQDEANPTWVWWDRQQMIQRLQGNFTVKIRVKSGNFGHQVNSDIYFQTVEIQMKSNEPSHQDLHCLLS